MKVTSFKLLFIISISTIAFSCEEKKNDAEPEKTNAKATGWKGSDNTDAIPENINNPFEGDGSNLPQSVDLSQYLPPIGDQGQFGTCVAWATAYNAKTAMEAIKFGLTKAQLSSPSYQLSPKYLFTALPKDKKGENCNGTDFTPALELMLTQGVASKAVVPYTDLGNCEQSNIDPSWNEDARKHKIKYYRKIDNTATSIKQALANKMPVVLGAKLDDSFMQWNSETVYQFATTTDAVGIHSYHAMCIIGYDNTKLPRGAFKVVNSWSEQWGAGGYIWVDYDFMINGFSFGKNFYVAVNDDQKPSTTDPNPPVGSGKNLTSWVFKDFPEPIFGFPTRRVMHFNIYNTGSSAINTSDRWGYAFLYYNAFDATDYGVALYDEFDPSAPRRFYSPTRPQGSIYPGLILNVDIPAGSNLAYEFQANGTNTPGEGDTLQREYTMPTRLNGFYYTVFVADVSDTIKENDELDNLFYTTEQDPKFYSDGIGDRKAIANDNFRNPLLKSQLRSGMAKKYRTAVTPERPNAYMPEEIIGFLKKEARNGGLAKKIASAKLQYMVGGHSLQSK